MSVQQHSDITLITDEISHVHKNKNNLLSDGRTYWADIDSGNLWDVVQSVWVWVCFSLILFINYLLK